MIACRVSVHWFQATSKIPDSKLHSLSLFTAPTEPCIHLPIATLYHMQTLYETTQTFNNHK